MTVSSTWFFLACAVLVGALLPTQAAINASLRVPLGSPISAAFTNFLVGIVVLVFALVVSRAPWPEWSRMQAMPWWSWTGGLLGATYVITSVLLVRKLGATTFVACILTGQVAGSLVLDQFALIGLIQRSITPARLLGVVLLFAGVILVRRS